MLSLGAYLAGTAALLAVLTVLAYGAWAVRRATIPEWSGALARLAETVIALAVLFAVGQALGALHALSAGPVLGGELLAGLALAWVGHRRRPVADAATVAVPRPPAVPRRELGAALGVVLVVVIQWTAHVGDALGRGMTHPDTTWYHGPFAATFVQRHAFTGIERLGYDAARFFPFNAQLLHALGMLAYGRDILSPFLNLGWLALLLLGGWCIGARRGMGHVSVAAMAVGVGLPILTATQPGQASSDIACAALFVAAVALLLWSDLRPAPVAVAGLAGGMALSTKITVAAALAVLFIGVLAITLRRGRRVAAGLWTIAFLGSGSFWFIRDWVQTGNPLPWFELHLGPIQFERQIAPSSASLAHDILDPHAWRVLYLDGIWQGLGRAWPVVVLVLVGAMVGLLRWRAPATHKLVGIVLLAGAVGYVVTPLTGGFGFVYNLRYLSPILLVAFASVALLIPANARARAVALSASAVLVVVGTTMPNRELVDAWPAGDVVPAVVAVAVVVALVFAARTWRVVVVGPAIVVVALAAFWLAERHYLDHRYVADGLDSQPVDAFFRDVRNARVVVFGGDARYPMFGIDLSNQVGRGDLPPVQIAPGSCPGWRTHIGDSADYVVLLTGQFGFFVSPPEVAIAGDASARLVARSDHAEIYEISGPFDPTTCPNGS